MALLSPGHVLDTDFLTRYADPLVRFFPFRPILRRHGLAYHAAFEILMYTNPLSSWNDKVNYHKTD